MTHWRAKQYSVGLTRHKKLVVTLRRFKTSPARRSRVLHQFVLRIHAGSVKEIAFKLQTKRPVGRPAKRSDFWKLTASLPLLLIVGGLLGASIFGSRLANPRQLEPVKTFSATQSSHKTVATIKPLPYSIPTHISIPSVNIDADTISVGQDSAGAIQLPPILQYVTGWYKYSPTPGQIGPAIIVGHVDNYKNISVFWRLRYVKPGDVVSITRADGSIVHFKITDLKQFSQADFPTNQVYGNIDYPGLRLITCGGAFDTSTGSYTENTVVYAKMIK